MRKILLALAMIIVTASLQAVTIMWSLTTSENWNEQSVYVPGNGESYSVGIYLVYAQSDSLSAQDVWNTANGNPKNSATVWSQSIDTAGESTYTATTYTYSSASDSYSSTTTGATADFYLDRDTNVEFQATVESTTGDYFYLVLFNPSSKDSEDPQYVVTKAQQYTGTAATDTANGIYDTRVDGAAPEVGEYFVYVPTEWLGGQWQAVPEPTALALLALGIAGLALRRKV